MLGAIRAWFAALSTVAKVGVVSAAVVAGGAATSSLTPQQQTPTGGTSTSVCSSQRTTTTETQPIPFDKTTVNDPNTSKGQTSIQTAGVNGVETQTYDVTSYSPSGCLQDTKVLTKEVVTTQPVTEVTSVGTYVAPVQPTCTNGTYVNTAGNTVCSPETSSTVPAGATAQCVDGTYSFSQSRSGTCSHHGGVSQWL